MLNPELMKNETIRALSEGRELLWLNPKRLSFPLLPGEEAGGGCVSSVDSYMSGHFGLGFADIKDAEARLGRFAPFIARLFPETLESGGIIESPLTELSFFPKSEALGQAPFGARPEKDLGRVFLKRDSELPVAGSVKARGGIYEVLKHSEELALEAGILKGEQDDYAKLAEPSSREFFGRYKVQVGSTGNLGVSIGIMSAALGYKAVVHMSSDAKQWKKDYLRAHGVEVVEYDGDYGAAVEQGRRDSGLDPASYFVDDENSKALFLGYSVAALRLLPQLREAGIRIDKEHPLFVYIPCGVGGAPGGIAFGLKEVFGDNVHIFFVEPTEAPCMLLGMASGLHNGISVRDIGLSGKTHADGLAVGRPSGFAGRIMEPILSGEASVADYKLYEYLRGLWAADGIFIEPSACAAFEGLRAFAEEAGFASYLEESGLENAGKNNITHIVWATGGRLVPEEIRRVFLKTYL